MLLFQVNHYPQEYDSDWETLFFFDCFDIETIVCKNPVPPTVDRSTFDTDLLRNTKLYVPDSSVNLYKSTAVWQDFDILPLEANGVEDINVIDAPRNAKFIKDGQVVIEHNGKLYNTNGQEIK